MLPLARTDSATELAAQQLEPRSTGAPPATRRVFRSHVQRLGMSTSTELERDLLVERTKPQAGGAA